ncbi:hypothetical protein CEXT_316331 [Caerostris extrusa]|uniref:Uncharacterized protein n=1 Tax=Caerostris extrusa TaxID=172846 RepID=A0AAV4VM05_CAEEX|nr:hypothetical protein CEXT_316331 [Caerostris extrusa]
MQTILFRPYCVPLTSLPVRGGIGTRGRGCFLQPLGRGSALALIGERKTRQQSARMAPFLEFALHDTEPPFARNGSITPRAMISHNCDRSSL